MPPPLHYVHRFSRLRDFYEERPVLYNTAFVGFFQEEYDVINDPKAHPDVVSGVIRVALHRLAEQWNALTIDHGIVYDVVIRHLNSLSQAGAMYHPSFLGTMSYIANQPVHSVVIQDFHIPPTAFPCMVTKLLQGDVLRNLTLLDVSVPWSVFMQLPSLASLDVESVEVTDFSSGEARRPVSSEPRLSRLRWRNSTSLISKLLAHPEAHRLQFDYIKDLDCDMGSTQSTVWAWMVIQRAYATLEQLTIIFEGNSDDESRMVVPSVESILPSLHFPNLKHLDIVDTYDIADISPLSDETLLCLRLLPTRAPILELTTLGVKKLPVLSPELYKIYVPETFPHAIHAILRKTLDSIDRALCEVDSKSVWSYFTLRTGLNTPDAWTARRQLYENHPEEVTLITPQGQITPPDGYPMFCSLMDQLNDVSDEMRDIWEWDGEAPDVSEAFRSFYLPRLAVRQQQGLVAVATILRNDQDPHH